MSNIAEGYDRGSRAEFHQFLLVAKASCAEVRSQLYVAHDVGYINATQFQNIKSYTEEPKYSPDSEKPSTNKRPKMNQDNLSSNLSSLTSHNPLRWLVTGGCGFIGRNLIKNLVEQGNHYIRVIDNLKVGTRSDLAQVCNYEEISVKNLTSNLSPLSSIDLIVGDILDADLALKATKDIDVIIHLAANTGVAPSVKNPRMDCETNVIGTLNYLEAARQNKVKRFIFASSGAPIGEVTPPIHEEMAPHPVSPYGASKLAGEGYCSAYYRTFGLETVVLRFGNVYGPYSGKKDSVIAKFIKQALSGEAVEIYGDGTQTRDFIYVRDLVKAIRLAGKVPGIGGETFQIATSREHTVNEVANQLQSEINNQCQVDMTITYGAPRLGDVKRNYSDTSKADGVLGWRSHIGLEAGIAEIVRWFTLS